MTWGITVKEPTRRNANYFQTLQLAQDQSKWRKKWFAMSRGMWQ